MGCAVCSRILPHVPDVPSISHLARLDPIRSYSIAPNDVRSLRWEETWPCSYVHKGLVPLSISETTAIGYYPCTLLYRLRTMPSASLAIRKKWQSERCPFLEHQTSQLSKAKLYYLNTHVDFHLDTIFYTLSTISE